MTNMVNWQYLALLTAIFTDGKKVVTRNAETYRNCKLSSIEFGSFPLITTRKTAWKLALAEMEWFLSGNAICPEKLLPWWKGQLSRIDEYLSGYGEQFRHSSYMDDDGELQEFDQIKFLQEAFVKNPTSRRLVLTSWNPGEMANIIEMNGNPNTPTTCHNTLTQFFVEDGKLNMKTYQRSADMLLGVPHNWVQSWAMLMYFAYWANLEVGTMIWQFGDAHVYNEPSHIATLNQFLVTIPETIDVKLVYKPIHLHKEGDPIPSFKADDFEVIGEIPEPTILTKPRLL